MTPMDDPAPLADEMDRDYLEFLQRERAGQAESAFGYTYDDRLDDLN